MSLDIRTGFRDRTLFITGGTGFVGKVLLYKILKEFPDVRRIYLLMRGKHSRRLKKYMKAQERLEVEVLGSACFDGMRNSLGEAKWKTLSAKVKAVDGDIVKDNLGLNAQDYAHIVNEVQLIVHLAATVNFNARLDEAIQINSLGGLRTLTLAKACKKLEAMVHVSTCYVNYGMHGRTEPIEERIFPSDLDAEALCKRILGLHPDEAEKQGRKIVEECGFPNTYTMTKNIGERLLQRYRGDVPLAIVRPSIISCSLKEPYPGWVDALTAVGVIILTVSLGVLRELVCDDNLIADITPVDYVVNVILKALFKTALEHKAQRGSGHDGCGAGAEVTLPTLRAIMSNTTTNTNTTTPPSSASSWNTQLSASVLSKLGKTKSEREGAAVAAVSQAATSEPSATTETTPAGAVVASQATPPAREPLMIYQVCTTGSLNQVTWGRLGDALKSYVTNVKQHPKALGPCKLTFTSSNLYYLMRYNALRYAPYMLLKQIADLPEPIGSEERRKMADRLGRAVRRADMLNNEFKDFITREWIYASTNSMALDEGLDDYSRKAFAYDPYEINWYIYTQLYIYGIFKYIVRDTGFLPLPVNMPTPTEMFKRASSL